MVGNLPELSPGEHLRLQGHWDTHPKHGTQFKAEICEQTLPATVAGIEGYLRSRTIKGIGPKLAERIVGRFKEETCNVVASMPKQLLEVPGSQRAIGMAVKNNKVAHRFTALEWRLGRQ